MGLTPAARWVVPLGNERAEWDTYVQIRAAGGASQIQVTALTEDKQGVNLGTIDLASNGRVTLGGMNYPALLEKRFSIRVLVTSGSPVVVEKALFQRPGAGSVFMGSSLSAGTPY